MNEFLRANDLAKIGCHDCKGCYSCCSGMGDSVWVDPFDACLLQYNLNMNFEQLLGTGLELHVEDGLIMPNLKMNMQKEGNCYYLGEDHRCNIHSFRPGLCRLFPLGRNFEDGKLTYFILEGACPMPNKTKVRISKWINQEGFASYERYLVSWHGLTKNLRLFLQRTDVSDEEKKAVNMQFLQYFFISPYKNTPDNTLELYDEIEKRVDEFEKTIY